MSLASGTRLGPYEIVSPLGAGGMGEVYKARDTRLGREVAIKVIPGTFLEDEDRRARFEREAKTLAALSHPGIAVVHSFEEVSGQHILVMELLEGESLRERLEEGALTPRKAVDLAVQIANGLAVAHEKGIVHRDLKPENVFVTKEGRVKILDFGLAKLTQPEPAGDLTSAPTTPAPTDTGVVMGTAGYMSPEQVQGLPADHRSDIFSFGAVIYEMLSGNRAFHGNSAVETLHAILKDDAPEISGIQTNISPALERIVRRCLEKSPDERFQSARDVAFALEAVSDVSLSKAGAALAGTTGPRFRPFGALLIAAGVSLVGALGVTMGRALSKRPLPCFHRLTFQRGNIESARFAPDGQTVVFSAAWNESPVEIFSTRAEAAEWRSLGLPPARVESISRPGQIAIRYVSGTQRTGTLAQVPLAGGAPREIVERVRKADWAPDGGSLAIVRDVDGKDRLEFPVGTVLYETKPSGWISDLRVSPDGDLVAFFDHLERFDDRGSVVIVDRKRNRRTLSDSWSGLQGLAWRPDNKEVWFSGWPPTGTLAIHAVTLSGKVRLVEQIAGNLRLLDVSSSGDVLVSQFTHRKSMKILAPGQTEERDLSWLDGSGAIDLSDDGKVLLFDEGLEGSRSRTAAVYVRKTDGSPAVRLGEGAPQALSPDGKWALVALQYPEPAQLILLPTGAGESRPVPGASIHHERAVWLPDGKRILFSGNEPGKESRLYVQDPFGGSPKAVTAEGVELSWLPRPISPDGRWVAALSPGLKLHPIEGGEPRPVPGREPGEIPSRWSADGRRLYLAHHNEMPRKIFRVDVATGRRELVRELMPADRVGVDSIFPVLLTPDGQTIVYSYSRRLSDLYLVTGLR